MVPISRFRLSRRAAAAVLVSMMVLGGVTHVSPRNAAAAVHRAGSDPNTLTIGWELETSTMDPIHNPLNQDIWVFVNIYDQLVRTANDGASLTPDLATSWDISKDGLVYTFHLRKGVVFHNGQPLTSQDVKFTLDRARDPNKNPAWAWSLAAVKNIAAPDASTVVITLHHLWAPFLSDVSLFDAGVIPEAYFKKVGAAYLSSHPIGTGPYMFETWKRGQYLRLKKNSRYWAASQFPMQHVEFDLIPNANTRLLKVEAGELDVDNVLPFNQVAEVKNNPAVKVGIDRSTRIDYFIFNTKVKPFDDVNVRQAINHAIDRAAIVRAVLYGYGTPANSFIPAGAIDYDPNIPVAKYDLNLARQYLSKSSVPHGFSMTMETRAGNAAWDETAVIFKAEVAPLGIKVDIKPLDPTTESQNETVGKYHFTEEYWTNDIPDPDELVTWSVNYNPGSWNFFTWYNNPQAARLSSQAEQVNDPATRQRLYFQIQQIWARDMWLPALYYSPFINAIAPNVQGFHQNPLGYFVLQGVHKT